MNAAAEECAKKGISDPDVIREAKLKARAELKAKIVAEQAKLTEESKAKAEAEAAARQAKG